MAADWNITRKNDFSNLERQQKNYNLTYMALSTISISFRQFLIFKLLFNELAQFYLSCARIKKDSNKTVRVH